MCEGSIGSSSKSKKNEKSVKSDQNKENDILSFKMNKMLSLSKSEIFN